MIRLDGATFLLQWAVGGLAFLLVITRRREIGVGFGWLLRGGFGAMAGASPRVWARVLVSWAFSIVMLAIFVRVIASWIGVSEYRRWMRPFVLLTDWIIHPIRRVLPAAGMIDFSPMVAWLVLWVARGFVLGML